MATQTNINDNIFIRHIYDKNKGLKLIRWFKYRKFLKMIDKSVPTFDILWQIADFIKILEYVYLYDNSTTNTIYSSTSFNEDENGFVIRKNNYTIKIKLYEQTRTIALEIDRSSNSKQRTSFRFIDGESSQLDSENNEHLMINIENMIMDAVKQLFIKYYKLKRIL